MSATNSAGKKPGIALTPGSHVRLRSAGPEDSTIDSSGIFRGLVSIGGDNAIAIELDQGHGDEKGRVRLVPIPAILTIDILEAAKPEEEKRSEPTQSPGYFR